MPAGRRSRPLFALRDLPRVPCYVGPLGSPPCGQLLLQGQLEALVTGDEGEVLADPPFTVAVFSVACSVGTGAKFRCSGEGFV